MQEVKSLPLCNCTKTLYGTYAANPQSTGIQLYACEDKWKQLFAESKKFNYEETSKHTAAAYKKYHYC